jgi:opacity protein-like surface antigen
MAQALPFNSAIGLNWSDAHIGQLSSPNFGVGLSTGFTTMSFSPVIDLLGSFNLNLPFGDNATLMDIGLPLPGYTIDVRLGGVVLPFDIGLKFGFLPQDLLGNMFEDFNFGIRQMLLGVDFRYSLINNRKIFPLRFSVGLGFNYLDGGINAGIPTNLSFSFTDVDDKSFTIVSSEANAGLEWRTINTGLKVQVSVPLKFLTPYAGAGVSYAWSQAGYRYKAGISIEDASGAPVALSAVEELLKEYGLTDISEEGFESIIRINGISARAFGGASINMSYVRLDLTGMYEFISGYFGVTVGLRFQL